MDIIEYLRERPHLLIPIFMTLLILLKAAWRIGKPAPVRTYRQGCIVGFVAGIIIGIWVGGAIYFFTSLRSL